MAIEDKISINNMLINAYHIDERVNRKASHSPLTRIKRGVRRTIRSIRHVANLSNNGASKTAILMIDELFPTRLEDYPELHGFNHEYELKYIFKHSKKNRIAVYTAIFGDYDTIKEPLYISDNCDYYIITDMNVPKESVWKPYNIEDAFFEEMDNYHKSKYCKMHPHVLFPTYDYSLWVDGNVIIIADINPLFDRMDQNSKMATFQNPLHNCIYTEGKFLIYYNAVKLKMIRKQLNQYRKEGFPEHFGMREFSIIARKHNDELLIDLMSQWWKEVNTFTMRDQISFPYILWKNGLAIDYIQLLGGNWRDNPRFICASHNWRVTF